MLVAMILAQHLQLSTEASQVHCRSSKKADHAMRTGIHAAAPVSYQRAYAPGGRDGFDTHPTIGSSVATMSQHAQQVGDGSLDVGSHTSSKGAELSDRR